MGDRGLISSKDMAITNYRPISVLPAVTKITERLVHSLMMSSLIWDMLKLQRTVGLISCASWSQNSFQKLNGELFQ